MRPSFSPGGVRNRTAPHHQGDRMNWVLTFLRSSIGRKIVMAVSGVMLFGFVLVHMIGNLQVYTGPTALDEYGVFLREILHGTGIWIARGGLLLAAIAHVWAAWSLTRSNQKARPEGYRERQNRESTLSSRTMRWSGVFVLVFVVYHLLHFTIGTVHPDFVEGAVNHNFVTGLRVLWVAIFYMVATLLLGFHLYHGVWSMLQTVGLSHPRYDALRKRAAAAFAVIVVLGNLSFPLAVLTGVVK
jgi:succinate dehydrogenase / fumarate reductase, cytochrome b subunit